MPKVRDLGINFIPATMRPLEIGAGGAPSCEPVSGPCKDSSCHEPSFDNCDPSGCQKGASCIEPSSDKDKDKDKDKDRDRGDERYERPLNAAAIAQLKQQMRAQLGA